MADPLRSTAPISPAGGNPPHRQPGKGGKDVYLGDIWPSSEEVHALMQYAMNGKAFRDNYGKVATDPGKLWQKIAGTRGQAEEWRFEVTGTECSHEHCGVQRNGDGWACPCHGARFALDGARRSGPAPVGLTSYDWMLDGDVLTILAP